MFVIQKAQFAKAVRWAMDKCEFQNSLDFLNDGDHEFVMDFFRRRNISTLATLEAFPRTQSVTTVSENNSLQIREDAQFLLGSDFPKFYKAVVRFMFLAPSSQQVIINFID